MYIDEHMDQHETGMPLKGVDDEVEEDEEAGQVLISAWGKNFILTFASYRLHCTSCYWSAPT